MPGMQDECPRGLPGQSRKMPIEVAATAPTKIHLGDRDEDPGRDR